MIKSNLEAYRDQLQRQIDLVESLLRNFDRLAGVSDEAFESALASGAGLRSVPSPTPAPKFDIPRRITPPRVRGVLAAVREIVDELSGSFDKNDVMAKLREKDPELAASVSPANLRNTLRLLAKNGQIKVQIDATSTTCAKYISKRTAA